MLPIATHLEIINASMNRSYELYHISPLERKVYVQGNDRKQFLREVSDLTILHDLTLYMVTGVVPLCFSPAHRNLLRVTWAISPDLDEEE